MMAVTTERCTDREFWRNCLLSDDVEGMRIENEERFLQYRNQIINKTKIFVGAGTCGFGAGAGKTIKAIERFLEEHEFDADIIQVGCVGLCAEEPLVDIQMPNKNRLCFKKVTEDKVDQLLNAALFGGLPLGMILGQYEVDGAEGWENIPSVNDHPFFVRQKRLVLANCGLLDPENINEYLARDGYKTFIDIVKSKKPIEVCNMAIESGLRGRGGGGFKSGLKWKFAHDTPAEKKYMICNADEGDPGAFMDRAIIEGDPHRVLEGLAIAAYAIGAQKAYIYIRAEYPLAIARLRKAIKDAKSYGLMGQDIYGSGYNLEVVIKCGAGAFVCGEETALIRSIEGKRGMPIPRPPFPTTSGLFNCPTVINNVETLASVPVVFSKGTEFFSALGTEKSKGTKVFALSGNIARSGLVEVEIGTKIRDVIFDIGGGIPDGYKFKAVQFGGPSGGCIPEAFLDLEIDYETLQSAGAMMGSGGMVVMDERTCMVDLAKYFMQFIQSESCGKCIPCREGTKQMLEILDSLTHNRAQNPGVGSLMRFKSVTRLDTLAKVIKDTSLCGLGKSAPNPVLSTLKWFRDEYEDHVFDRVCTSGTCTDLVKLRIDPDVCRNCGLCAKKCPTHAIYGNRKEGYRIELSECINCFNCQDVCKFEAVLAE